VHRDSYRHIRAIHLELFVFTASVVKLAELQVWWKSFSQGIFKIKWSKILS